MIRGIIWLPFRLGCLVAWLGFLVEEIKSGVMVQEPHYPMIVWILLGLSNAAVKTLKTEATPVTGQKPTEKVPC